MRLRKLLILVSLLSILVSCGDNKKDIKTRVIKMYSNAPKVDLESGDVNY